jgi:hypothetical protein
LREICVFEYPKLNQQYQFIKEINKGTQATVSHYSKNEKKIGLDVNDW